MSTDNKLIRIDSFYHEFLHAIKRTHRLRLKPSNERVDTIDKTIQHLIQEWLNSGNIQEKIWWVNEEFPFEVSGYSTRYDIEPIPGEKPSYISLDEFDEPQPIMKSIPIKITPKEFGEDILMPKQTIPMSELFSTEPTHDNIPPMPELNKHTPIQSMIVEEQLEEILSKDANDMTNIVEDDGEFYKDSIDMKMTDEEEAEIAQEIEAYKAIQLQQSIPKLPAKQFVESIPLVEEKAPIHGVLRSKFRLRDGK